MRNNTEDIEVTRLLRDFDKVLSEEREAASHLSSIIEELEDLEINIDLARPGWQG